MIETETYACGRCRHPVVTYWSKDGLESGDYLLLGEVFFHKGECAETYLDEFQVACND